MGRWLICYVEIHKDRDGKKLTSVQTDRYGDTPLFIQAFFFSFAGLLFWSKYMLLFLLWSAV